MKLIDQILLRYSTLMQNNREVPDFLMKQVDGIYLASEDFDRGLQQIVEGLMDERDHIDNRLEMI